MNRFRRSGRIRSPIEFTSIIRHGAYSADDVLVVNVRPNSAVASHDTIDRRQYSRLGISIPRKTGPAVVRNRWKRWIREAFRTHRGVLPDGLDIIARPKRGATGGYLEVTRSLLNTVNRAAGKLNT